VQAGIYAQAYRLLDASNMIAYLFAGLLLPIFSHMLKRKEDIRELLRLSYSLLAIPAIVVACLSYFFREPIMDLLYHEHVSGSAMIFSILMIGFFAISTTYIFGTLLTANGNLKQLNLMAGAGMVLNIGLNLYLIPQFEAAGAAVASLITQVTTALIQVVLCLKIFHLKADMNLIIRFIVFILTILVITYITSSLPMHWIYNLLLSGLASIAIASILNLLNINAMIKILKNGDA
jgi:O-antigen/teichoic acid export membrane protein